MAKSSYTLIWTALSRDRLGEIYLWNLVNYSERRANKIVDSLYAAAQQVRQSPKAYPKLHVSGREAGSVRVKTVRRTYKLLYFIQQDTITVLDIFHVSRNPSGLEKWLV